MTQDHSATPADAPAPLTGAKGATVGLLGMAWTVLTPTLPLYAFLFSGSGLPLGLVVLAVILLIFFLLFRPASPLFVKDVTVALVIRVVIVAAVVTLLVVKDLVVLAAVYAVISVLAIVVTRAIAGAKRG